MVWMVWISEFPNIKKNPLNTKYSFSEKLNKSAMKVAASQQLVSHNWTSICFRRKSLKFSFVSFGILFRFCSAKHTMIYSNFDWQLSIWHIQNLSQNDFLHLATIANNANKDIIWNHSTKIHIRLIFSLAICQYRFHVVILIDNFFFLAFLPPSPFLPFIVIVNWISILTCHARTTENEITTWLSREWRIDWVDFVGNILWNSHIYQILTLLSLHP